MPIRRPRGPKPALRHLAFLEAMASSPAESAAHREARTGFLVLRQLDHWVMYGATGGAPTERSTDAAAESVRTVVEDAELRSAYDAIITAIPAISDADPQPVLPRVFALGSLLEQRGRTALAADVYTTVSRHVDPVAHLDLAYDASMRQAACLRQEGQLDQADQAYTQAGTLAARTRDRTRVLMSRMGRAKVVWARGNLGESDSALEILEREARALENPELVGLVLHERAVVAHLRGDTERAVRIIWTGYQMSPDEYDRELMMEDLANFLSQLGAYDSARDALQLIELGSKRQSARWIAQVNLMDLSFRTRNEVMFRQYRQKLADAPLPGARRVTYLLDVGRGATVFGDVDAAREALTTGRILAVDHGLHQRVHQFDEALKAIETSPRMRESVDAANSPKAAAPDDIRDALRQLLNEVAGAAA